jgi:predicted nuclease with TOPRIM domain
MDCRAALEAARRENRRLLKRCEVLQAEVMAERKRAEELETWARSLIGSKAA